MDRLGRSNIHTYEPEVIPNKATATSGPLFIPKPKFNDKMFDGLRDEDREQTEYLDEDDQQVEDDEDPDTKAKVEDKSIELANIETVETGKMSLRRQGSTQVDIIDQANKLEKRYCSDCYVDQPIRSKHCKDCGFCIATYDHHCIWVGNCIGERNRPLFMAYLLIQSAELFICIGRPLMIIQEIGILKSATTYPILVTLVISYFILTLTLISLLGYHVYFMFSNMTTWEYISWSNITYLEGFEKKDGSPFSISPTHNFILYMKPSPSTFYDWVPIKSKKR